MNIGDLVQEGPESVRCQGASMRFPIQKTWWSGLFMAPLIFQGCFISDQQDTDKSLSERENTSEPTHFEEAFPGKSGKKHRAIMVTNLSSTKSSKVKTCFKGISSLKILKSPQPHLF